MKRINDKNGINIYKQKPEEGQHCQTKIKGEEGYHSDSVYNKGYFETYENKRNRFVITRWKADLWLPVEE